MKWIFKILLVLAIPQLSFCQAKFIYSGTVDFERKINVQRQVSGDNDFFTELIKQVPPFYNSNFALTFDTSKSTYYPSADLEPFRFEWILGPAKENIVVNDFSSGVSISNKKVFEKKFSVNDSLSKMKWKLSSETRTIAGFECRKAVGIMCDSVYVVAFYTEEIPVSSGPESFNGLPGMILGIVIPRLYTTWFATKVSLTAAEPKKPDSKKSQAVEKTELVTVLNRSFQDWQKERERNIWWVML